MAPRGGQVGGGRRGVQLLDVLDPESLHQRVLHVVAGLLALPDQVGQTEHAGGREGEPDPAAGSAAQG